MEQSDVCSNLQFDLVCDYDTMVTLSQMIFMLGMLIGAVTSGVVSDR